MGVGDHPAHDGRRGPRRRILHRPALEPHRLSHGRRIYHPPLRRIDAEDVHLSVPLHLALYDRCIPLPHRQDHRSHGRHSAQHEHPAAGGFQHPLRHDRRPARRRGDRRVAVSHSVRRRHHRHSALADKSRRSRGFPRKGSGGIFPDRIGRLHLGVHHRLHVLQPLFPGRQLGLRTALHQRQHTPQRPQGGMAVRHSLSRQPHPLDAAADDLPRLQPRSRRAGSRKCLPADVQGGDALGAAGPDARRHDLRHGQLAQRHAQYLGGRLHQ